MEDDGVITYRKAADLGFGEFPPAEGERMGLEEIKTRAHGI